MDPALLGLPRAAPSRRGIALLVDLVIVGLLTAAGGVVLGLLAGVLFLRAALGKKEREKETPSRPAAVAHLAFRPSVGCLGGFILFVTIVSVWGGLGLRVVRLDGASIGWWSSFERYGGYAAGFATGLLGFFQVYWDPNRQATHDKISGTVVILEGRPPLGEPSADRVNAGRA